VQAKLVMRLLAMSTAAVWIRTTGQRTEMRDVGWGADVYYKKCKVSSEYTAV
jgi:hypothetical protein